MTVMTEELVPPGNPRGPGEGQADEWDHPFFADPEAVTAESYPSIKNISAGHLMRRVVRPLEPDPPEYVTLPMPGHLMGNEMGVAVAKWNLLWESAQFRRRFFGDDELPSEIMEIADQGDLNVSFVPRTTSRYYEYAPLFHLLSSSQAQRQGLPLLKPGIWPFMADYVNPDRFLPSDFSLRLERAWASAVWRHLSPGSPESAFSGSDPIRLLAHNLDFWIPAADAVLHDILRSFPVVAGEEPVTDERVPLIDGGFLEGAIATLPRCGGTLWRGEDWAAQVVRDVVDAADATGQLRAIVEAVRSNRVEDDFSDRWSYAREDFERKLYHKRNKVQVRFVELTDTIPVQGPETEVEGNLVVADFMTLLDKRERQVVVLLHSGYSKLGEIAGVLGYKNHSPVSKYLASVRLKAGEYFDVPWPAGQSGRSDRPAG
jgi:hypothetical protein